jgi:hypothetical protein
VLLKDTGRPEKVYGKRCKEDQLEHEVLVTEAELLLGGHFTRDAPIGKTFADGLLVRGGIRFWVEVDNETMTAKQMRDKWSRYPDSLPENEFILVICHTRARLRRLMRSAQAVKSVALFTRFRWLWSRWVEAAVIDRRCKRVGL